MPTRAPVHRPASWAPAQRVRVDTIDREYGTQRWRKLARSVIARDGGICAICRLPGADTAHHIREKRDGGEDLPDNLQSAHRACHNRVHGRRGG